jgi:5-methyltetrahydropteroyltriglutamate--homocysteine methyltransferase
VKTHTKRRLKVPITGPYTLADWSFNEFYQKRLTREYSDFRKLKYEAKRELVLDIGKEIIRPNLKALVKAGADYIQVDEPALTTKPDEVEFFIEAFNEATAAIDCKLSVHICYSDYRTLYPRIMELKNCSQLALEFANRGPETKPYDQLNLLREFNDRREIGLGVSDVHTDTIENPELIRDRISYATKVLEDPSRIYVNPDCGLRTRNWDIAYAKLCNIVKGAEMARKLNQ